jgi:hypothetical protein
MELRVNAPACRKRGSQIMISALVIFSFQGVNSKYGEGENQVSA